jgi:hypothetical protein
MSKIKKTFQKYSKTFSGFLHRIWLAPKKHFYFFWEENFNISKHDIISVEAASIL